MTYAVRFTYTDPAYGVDTENLCGDFDDCLKTFMRIVGTQHNILVGNLLSPTVSKVELLRKVEDGNIILASVYLEDLTNEEE